ncbi:putative PurR-regulated permease PerM [Aneurinibacillus soli]|uniref:AI-2 transport protein TqsA n=1 Tax=Aneurinibacillus soli TaxID=1500254 RepID=A0A0U5BFV1_9BACL|nr:AI-2E family transporter [Aneurinibacillus soli]PYE62491.1 putative PurR-regulated permease PerM [Aneurinibacillus soli]BAU27054.1 AI-2 transport protein TqsA [Aneurinibacillus soli]
MGRLLVSRWLYGAVTALLIVGIVYLAGQVSPFFLAVCMVVKKVLTPFFLGLVVAYLLNPVVTFLTNHHFPRGLAIFLIYTLFLLFVAFVIINGGPVIMRESRELSGKLPELVFTYREWLGQIQIQQADSPFPLHSGLTGGLRRIELAVNSYVAGLFTEVDDWLDRLLLVMLIPFIVFYMLKDMKTMQQGTLLLVPPRHRSTARRILHDIDYALGQYIRGQLIVCAVVGVLAYVGYFLIGLPYAGVFALLVAVTNIIPYIGPFFGAVPAILFALTISWKVALYAVIVNLIIQILEGNIVSPFIVGRSLHLHPLFIILAVTIGGEIAGLAGLIFAVPVVACLKVVIEHVVIHTVRREKTEELD